MASHDSVTRVSAEEDLRHLWSDDERPLLSCNSRVFDFG